MTDWTNPRTWTVGEKVTKAIMDLHIRDNLNHLKESITALIASSLTITNRKGGSSTDWTVQGTTTYTPSSPLIMCGVARFNITSPSGSIYTGNTTVTIPAGFTKKPVVIANQISGYFDVRTISAQATTTTSVFLLGVSTASVSNVDVTWVAIGE